MNSPSFIARIARITLMTGLVLVALILLATYASAPRASSMMSWLDTNKENVVTGTASGSAVSSDLYTGTMMGYSIAPVAAPSTDASSTSSIDQRVIKSGSIDMTSNNVSSTVTAISTLALTRNGFIQTSSTSDNESGKATAYVVLRVPTDVFEATMSDIVALGVHVNTESMSGEDVTEQFTDVSARLTAAKAQEAQYLVILKSATSVGDILAVQEHLATVRSEIESLQGQVNFLENETDLATISVTVSEETTAATASENKFDPARDANSAIALVITLGQRAITVLIWAGIIGAAFGIPVGLVALLYWIITRRHNASAKRRR